jgi:tetratricopeptide (TPR) repeat protein
MAVDAGSPPFVGRAEAVATLHRRFEDARSGAGGVTLVVGATGVGKSTLVAEIVREIRDRGIRLIEGRAPAADAPPPFSLLRSVLEDARQETRESAASGPAAGPPDGVIIGFAPGLKEGAEIAAPRIEERLLVALDQAGLTGDGVRDPVWAALSAQFFEFTKHGPTVLVVEDLHRADEPSLEALEFLARRLEDRSLWILATARSFSELSAARRERLERFEQTTHARRVGLPPLSSDEVREFLRGIDPGREFSDEEIARRYSETGGNPLLLEQLDHRVRRRPGGPGDADPGTARSFDLPLGPAPDPTEAKALAAAAVAGPEVSFDLLRRVTGEDEERLAEAVDRLVARGLLLERPREILAFGEERIRHELYDRLPGEERQLLHRRVGEALEAAGGTDAESVYALARHFYLGKEEARSLRYNRAAARIAETVYAPEVAGTHLERALENLRAVAPDDEVAEVELALELAQQLDHSGRLSEAESLLRRHLERPGISDRLPVPLRALGAAYLARIQTNRGDWAAAERATALLLADPRLADHPTVRTALHRLRGEALYYQGRYAEALQEHTEELRLARDGGNERAAALGRWRRASTLAMMGSIEEALAEGRTAAADLERLDDLREASHAHLFLGVIWASLKSPPSRPTEALAEFDEAARLGEKAHDPRRVGWALFNAADVLREVGQLDEASERNRRARELLERIGDRFGVVQSRIVGGKVLLSRREFDRAEAELLEAYRLVRELNAPADEVDVVLRLAELAAARGDRAGARRRIQELERQNVVALRPDIAPDFERLRRSLERAEGGDGADRGA